MASGFQFPAGHQQITILVKSREPDFIVLPMILKEDFRKEENMTTTGIPPHKVFAEAVKSVNLDLPRLAKKMGLSEFHTGELLNGRSALTDSDAMAMAEVTTISAYEWMRLQKAYVRALAQGTDLQNDSDKTHFHLYLVEDGVGIGKDIKVFFRRDAAELYIEAMQPVFRNTHAYVVSCEVEDCVEIESLCETYSETVDLDKLPSTPSEEKRSQKPFLKIYSDFHSALFISASKLHARKGHYPNVLTCTLPQIGPDGDYRNLHIVSPASNADDLHASKCLEGSYLLTDLGELYGSIIINQGREDISKKAQAIIDQACEEYSLWVESVSFEDGVLNLVVKAANLGFGINHFMNISAIVAASMQHITGDE